MSTGDWTCHTYTIWELGISSRPNDAPEELQSLLIVGLCPSQAWHPLVPSAFAHSPVAPAPGWQHCGSVCGSMALADM